MLTPPSHTHTHTHIHIDVGGREQWCEEWAALASRAAAVKTRLQVMSEQQGTMGSKATFEEVFWGFCFMAA